MIKKNLKLLIITSLIIILPMLAGIALWDQLPDRIPMHWNFKGEVDNWSGKAFAVFGTPLFMLAIQWIGVIATYSDPKRHSHSEKILYLVFWIIPIMSVLMHTLVYASALGKEVHINEIMPIFMGLLFTLIGNYLPKCKQNYTIGIKIPWTLNSEENWNRTHRLAGWLWTACGIVIMLSGFLGFQMIFFAAVLLMVFVPLIYSYTLYRKGI